MENSSTTEFLETAIVKGDDSIVAAENGHPVNWDQFMRWPRHLQRRFQRLVDVAGWLRISQQQRLDEDFIREFAPYLHWTEVMIYSNPPEDLVHRFSKRIN